MTKYFDYIIIGGGSAGCVLANRLSSDARISVLLIEAGEWDKNPWIHIPLGYGRHFENPKVNWMYHSAPEAETSNRKIFQPRGKVMGGSSSINGLVYIRGQKEDYDNWDPERKHGWSYDSLLKYFKKSENNSNIDDIYHGTKGELNVSSPLETHELAKSFIEAGIESGHPYNADFNGASQEGFGPLQMTIKNGIRSSASSAFIKNIRRRKNLKIYTKSHVQKILFDKNKAVGVEVRIEKKDVNSIYANKEIILSAGAFNSPQILQLSGVGPKKLLEENNIILVKDLEAVGKNLQDHYNGRLIYKTNHKYTLNTVLNNPITKLLEGVKYLTFRKGFLNMGSSVAAGFIHSNQYVKRPDLHISLILFSADKAGSVLHKWSGFSIIIRLLRPQSTGEVNIKSNNPYDQPVIKSGYFKDKDDRKKLVQGFKITRKIMSSKPIKDHIIEEYSPGVKVKTDKDLMSFLSARGGISYHPVGTCRMGDTKDSVVDFKLKVHGIKNLRVVDASIMPSIISGNTNAPVIMIAEKASDLILNEL